ncbi:collagen alpha-1(VI) chain-like [Mercenaria mercenaria]|uniref:collagen alpha-1(VI) chain-like n=1 Tax=Mercenaria mercenaria TaxID=6596 RepID=UPI00234ED5E7|nr:collagen alpha-1(VI) chain-like [Mercenaria mercenaria]
MEKLKLYALTGLLCILCVISSGVITYFILNHQFESQVEERFNGIKREFKYNITTSTLNIGKSTFQAFDFNLRENNSKIEKQDASTEITIVEGFSCSIYTGNGTLSRDSKLYRAATVLLDSRIEKLESNISKGEIKGDKGDPGTDGTSGMKGGKGSQGEEGPQGPQGTNGIKGHKGEQGMVGATGTKGLKGEHGPVGEKGDKGEVGLYGIPGKKGYPGARGLEGPSGWHGPRGPRGTNGEKGEKGPTGRTGDKGTHMFDNEFVNYDILLDPLNIDR